MSNILFITTTANQLAYTKLMFESLWKMSSCPKMDILVIDDASEDGTQAWCKKNKINYITKDECKGLTHSWNLGYKAFVEGNYDYLIYANNDILIPEKSLDELLKTAKNHIAVGAMSTLKGVGYQKLQALGQFYSLPIDDTVPENYQAIQDAILKENKTPHAVEIPDHINGFFFCLNKDIKKYQLADGILFDPKNINTENELDLCRRIKEPKVVCIRSFIFHFKGVSFQDYGRGIGSFFISRDLTWKTVQKLKKRYLGIPYCYYFLKFYLKKAIRPARRLLRGIVAKIKK